MDSATEDIYLQKIEEFVYDEEKTVTCRWLSINLSIDIKESKYLLEKYVSDINDTKGKDVAVTYLLSGTASDGNLHITIVKGDELDLKKATFTKVSDQQIYSIQKCKNIDLNFLSMVDYFDINNPKEEPVLGSVVSTQCIKRVLKTKKLPPIIQKPPVQSKPSIFAKVPLKSEPNNTTKESTTAKTKQNNGINNFFTKSSTQADVKPVQKDLKPVQVDVKPVIKDIQDSPKKETNTQKTSPKNSSNTLIDSDSDDEQPKPNNEVKSNHTQNKKRSVKRSKKNNKREPSPKRRKRIIEHDSDSDDIFGSDTKEDEHEAPIISDIEEDTPKAKVNLPLAPKNKKRKQVDRTYTDKEGYIITTKEWVEESPSEDEVIQETPQKDIKKLEAKETQEMKTNSTDKKLKKSESSDLSDSKETKTANGAPKGGKKGKKPLAPNQPTLMNFFKRVV